MAPLDGGFYMEPALIGAALLLVVFVFMLILPAVCGSLVYALTMPHHAIDYYHTLASKYGLVTPTGWSINNSTYKYSIIYQEEGGGGLGWAVWASIQTYQVAVRKWQGWPSRANNTSKTEGYF